MAIQSWRRSTRREFGWGSKRFKRRRRTSYAAKLKNALHGRAWTLCHRKPEIAAQKLLQISEAEPSANAGPKAAVQLVVRTVRAACEKVAPLLKTQTFEDYFFEKGRRRLGESIQDYISRREGEYERLSGLTQGHTKLSTDLQAFFLLRNAGVTPPQRRAILGQAGNEYDWDKIVEAMLIQLDGGDEPQSKGWKGNYKARQQNSYNPGGKRSWAFPIEEEMKVRRRRSMQLMTGKRNRLKMMFRCMRLKKTSNMTSRRWNMPLRS